MAKRHVAVRRSALHRCLVEASVLSVEHGYSRALGPGMVVDLDDPVGPEVKLRDCVREEWFEAVEPAPAPTVREINDDDTDRS